MVDDSTPEMADLHRRGRTVFGDLVVGGHERLDQIFRATPALGELAVGVVYGHLHQRTVLDPRTREAVAIAAIVAAGCADTPLTVHVRTGLAAGLTCAEVAEVILETAAFAGFPRAVTAAIRLPELFADAHEDQPPAPAPRELLSQLLRTPHDPAIHDLSDRRRCDIAELLSTAPAIYAVGTGAHTAIAELTWTDRTPVIVHVHTDGDCITELAILEVRGSAQ